MNFFNRMVINASSIYASQILSALIQLALVPFILSRIGKAYYGAALLILTIQSSVGLLRGGFEKATVKYISENNAKDDLKGASEVLSSSAVLQGAVGFLGFLISLGVAAYVSQIFALPNTMRAEAKWATIILGTGIFATFFISPWHNAVAALERYDFLYLAFLLGRVFRALLIIFLLLGNFFGIITLVLAAMFGNLLERVFCVLFMARKKVKFTFRFSFVSRQKIKAILSFSIFDFLHTLSGFLYGDGAMFLAAHLISLDAVAALGIINYITFPLSMVMSRAAQMLVPVASRLKAKNELERLKKLVLKGTNLVVFMGGAVMAGLVPWMQPLLGTWLGPSYESLAVVAVILIGAAFLVNSLTCIHNMLGGVALVRVDGVSNVICTCLGLGLGVGLILVYHLGLLGLVMGLFSARLFRFLFISWYGSRSFKVPFRVLLWKGYGLPYLLIGAMITGALFLRVSVPRSWPSVILAVFTTSLLYVSVGFWGVLDAEIRGRFFEFFAYGKHYVLSKLLK